MLSEGVVQVGVDKALARNIHSGVLLEPFLTTIKAISSVTSPGFPGGRLCGELARQSIRSNASYRSAPPWSCDIFFLSFSSVLPNKDV